MFSVIVQLSLDMGWVGLGWLVVLAAAVFASLRNVSFELKVCYLINVTFSTIAHIYCQGLLVL